MSYSDHIYRAYGQPQIMLSPIDLPTSFLELMNAAASVPPESDRYGQIVGAIALLLSSIVCKRDADLFRGLMREVGLSVPTDAAKRILKTAQNGLNENQREWLQGQIDAILNGNVEVE